MPMDSQDIHAQIAGELAHLGAPVMTESPEGLKTMTWKPTRGTQIHMTPVSANRYGSPIIKLEITHRKPEPGHVSRHEGEFGIEWSRTLADEAAIAACGDGWETGEKLLRADFEQDWENETEWIREDGLQMPSSEYKETLFQLIKENCFLGFPSINMDGRGGANARYSNLRDGSSVEISPETNLQTVEIIVRNENPNLPKKLFVKKNARIGKASKIIRKELLK